MNEEKEIKREIAMKSFIKGHLVDICIMDGSVDINKLVESIYELRNSFNDTNALQKAVLGKIVGNQREDIALSQVIAVSRNVSYEIL